MSLDHSKTNPHQRPPPLRSLYDPRFEHDACGTGFVARVSGQPSHDILQMALEAVGRLAHRGAFAADGKSGDGAGVLTQIPHRLFAREAERLGCAVAEHGRYGVGMLFLERGDQTSRGILADALRAQGLSLCGWREVPVNRDALGAAARATLPVICQALVAPIPEMGAEELENSLYLARKQFEREARGGYVCSLSCRTIVYKALCAARQLASFYPDLTDPLYETALAIYHQRYATNTLPSWPLAQPFRLLAHNGEINTIWGNRAWMHAREAGLPREIRPILREDGSDSTSLDETLELVARHGRDLIHSLGMLIVPAWEERGARLEPRLAAFYRYHAPLMEPWDGPAAIAFSDGRFVGAALDRNGLRPCRYQITRDGLIVAGSEAGVLDLDPESVIEKGRLGPGQMLVVDLQEQRVLSDDQAKRRIAALKPFAKWVSMHPLPKNPGERDAVRLTSSTDLRRLQRLFGFTNEDLKLVLAPMAEKGSEPTWSMGDDTPIAPLARAPRSLYTFLRQRFAQVTNPPIDPLREAAVMSLKTWLGPRPSLLSDGPQPPLLELASPVLTASQLAGVRGQTHLAVEVLDCVFPPQPDSLSAALEQVCSQAEAAVQNGAKLLLLSDRSAGPHLAALPMALVTGGVHHRLLRAGLRERADVVVESGDCWDVHHLAVLIGYGAGAVCPWLALLTARELSGSAGEDRLVNTLQAGLRKVISKMGISTVASYRGGQMFEVLGLSDAVVDRHLTGTPSHIGGLGFAELEQMLLARHQAAFAPGAQDSELPDHGLVRFRRGSGNEHHCWQPVVVQALQRAVGASRNGADGPPEILAWQEFGRLAATEAPAHLRDLLEFSSTLDPVDLQEVEPAEAIARRFVTSAMSLGAISPEAHRTLAMAMNQLGARSNTGEGGEDPDNYYPLTGANSTNNKVKQIASARFGVTAEYIACAEELEIKIAQGSKPGEGGQLPGSKVTEMIARLRHAQPGISLISPPPHHDIYSIEDIAQLIHDLKRCNPRARIGVKLVSQCGVGTVAAGVAKAHADYIIIAGHSGGTGASPLSSIKHAGSPWELGLAEAQQVLIRNGLRSRVRLRVDGGLRTGRDILFAALLGAEEFAFGTAALVALGCDMARQCHLNTCPTGIATQRPELRAKFRGTPEQVVRYMLLLAEDVRPALASLGFRSLDQCVGRVDLLKQVRTSGNLDLSPLLARMEGDAPRCLVDRNDRPEEQEPVDEALTEQAVRAIAAGERFHATRTICNRDRSVGARLAGEIAHRWGSRQLPSGTVDLHFVGAAGQSFGAFCSSGIRLVLDGEANDYVGKGLCGGELVLRPTGAARFASHRNVILGNVALYGATSGRLFAAGRAGERFAVRNSGATAVVEGIGDHGCEYMTGGCVVVLGSTGFNFAAGMTGGMAYLFDEEDGFPAQVNPELVAWERPSDAARAELRALIEEHVQLTGSQRAANLLAQWERNYRKFWKVEPRPTHAPAFLQAAAATQQVRSATGTQPA